MDWPDFALGSLLVRTVGVSSYDSLQTKFRRRMHDGLEFLVSYTLSDAKTNAGDSLSGGGVGGLRGPDLAGWDLKNDIGLSGFHTKHALVFSGNYDLPGQGRDPRRLAHQLGGVDLQRPGADDQLRGGDRVGHGLLRARGRRSVRRQPRRDAVLQSGRVCDPESGCHDRSDRLQPARRPAQPGDRPAAAAAGHGLREAVQDLWPAAVRDPRRRPSTSRTRRRSTCPDR